MTLSSGHQPVLQLRYLLLIILIGFSLSGIFFLPAEGIKCYDCANCPTNHSNPNQLEKKEYDCNREDVHSAGSIFCVKIIRPDGFIDRRCANKNMIKEAERHGNSCDDFVTGKTRILNRLCFCQTDFCNGALPSVNVNVSFGLKMMAVLMMIMMGFFISFKVVG
ncbi:unnamed protein product [Orchesella dallaii]|uniref:Protein sleepless n=1 Tax=Orchesella dallaii TaxID=48710 RepID=A0ABP1RXW7_9HEXA